MEAKKINLKGIVRKPQNRASEDGNCAEVVNLRNWDGAWETVGDKEQIEELESGATQVTFHPINDQFETYVYRLGTDIKTKIIDKYAGTFTIKTLLYDNDKCIIKPFYNVLLVSSIESFTLSSFVFDVEAGDYRNRFTRLNDNLFGLRHYSTIDSIFSLSSDYPVSGVEALNDDFISFDEKDLNGNVDWAEQPQTVESFYKLTGDMEKINYPVGYVFLRFTLTLSNGSELPIGGLMKVATSDIYLDTDLKFKAKGYTYHIEAKQELINLLSGSLEDVLSEVNVYISRPLSVEIKARERQTYTHYDFSGDTDLSKISTLKRIGSHTLSLDNITNEISGNALDYSYIKTDNLREHFLDVSYATLTASVETVNKVSPIISVFDSLDDGSEELSTLHHLIALNTMSTYNERLLMAGVGVDLFKGYNVLPFVTNVLSDQYESVYSSTGDFLEMGISTEKIKTLASELASIYYLTIFFKIDTPEGTKTVKSEEIELHYFDPDNSDEIAFALNNIQYPDSRAFEYTVLLRIPGGITSLTEDGYYSLTRKLKKHDFLDLAFDDETFVVRNPYPSTELLPSQLTGGTLTHITEIPQTDTTYKDLNRVQASATGTVFSFPAKYSYRIGMDEVMNVTSITDEMSQGQFGQFPLIAFTKGMIWAMEIGSGETFISKIVPVANEICNNPDTITVVRGGILFSTTEGLKILQGKSVNDISEAVEGAISRLPIVGKFTLNTILERNNLTSSVDETAFKEFLNGARIGYNYYHDELILSSDAKDYSYLFSMKTGVWTKIMEKFDSFVNQFPHNYGLKGSLVYDLSKESKTGPRITLIATRPFKLTPDTYKKIEQVIVRGEFQAASGYLFGCTEGSDYRLISSGAASETIKQLYLHRTPYSAKTFILVIAANMEPGDYISEIDVMFNHRFTNKLR